MNPSRASSLPGQDTTRTKALRVAPTHIRVSSNAQRYETEAINGLVARRGAEVGVDATLHAKVDAFTRRIERGEIKPSRENALGL